MLAACLSAIDRFQRGALPSCIVYSVRTDEGSYYLLVKKRNLYFYISYHSFHPCLCLRNVSLLQICCYLSA